MQRLYGQFHACDQSARTQSDVVMTPDVHLRRATTENIFAATPAWLRIPIPTMDACQTSVSATRSWRIGFTGRLGIFHVAICFARFT
jgi:hypothetical protein